MTSRAPEPWRRGLDSEAHGDGYVSQRQTDPRIAARVHPALGDARTVLNVGAGAGSYEPADRHVIVIEPSATMRAQRPSGLAPAIDARAEALPLDDDSVDAAMAMLTIHHWHDPFAGLGELRRVARGPVVVLTFDAEALGGFWLLKDYAPELLADERRRFPAIGDIVAALGEARVEAIPVARDCRDGFGEAYYAAPRRSSTPQCAARSRRGRASLPGWRSASSARSRVTSRRGRGTSATTTCAPGPNGTAPCAW